MGEETTPKTVKLRFYGRFAYTRPFEKNQEIGKISVVAPHFDEARFGKHHVLMTVRRDQVRSPRNQTNVSPTLCLVTDAPQILNAEIFTWDITGCNVSFERNRTEPTAKLTTKSSDGEILDLGVLEDLTGREAFFDGQALIANPAGKAHAVIEVTAGSGVAKHVATTDNGNLLPLRNALLDYEAGFVLDPPDPTKPGSEPGPRAFDLLDLVEFTIEMTRDAPELIFHIRDCGGRDGIVTVFAGSENDDEIKSETNEVVVSFSHLCSSLPRPVKYDFEFSQSYSLLRKNPGDEVLILQPSQGAGEGGDCGYKAQVRYNREDGKLRTD